nr:uncharacterized protein LOC109156105 [Ipomoea batatas]
MDNRWFWSGQEEDNDHRHGRQSYSRRSNGGSAKPRWCKITDNDNLNAKQGENATLATPPPSRFSLLPPARAPPPPIYTDPLGNQRIQFKRYCDISADSFSESGAMFFPKLRACWGGATIAPTAETSSAGPSRRQQQQPDEADSIPPRRSTGSVNNAKRAPNWKPKLRMIAEDGVIGGDKERTSGAAGVRTAPSSVKKPPVKAKPKSSGTVSGASKHSDYYRTAISSSSLHSLANPAEAEPGNFFSSAFPSSSPDLSFFLADSFTGVSKGRFAGGFEAGGALEGTLGLIVKSEDADGGWSTRRVWDLGAIIVSENARDEERGNRSL